MTSYETPENPGDFNDDGMVDVVDLNILLEGWLNVTTWNFDVADLDILLTNWLKDYEDESETEPSYPYLQITGTLIPDQSGWLFEALNEDYGVTDSFIYTDEPKIRFNFTGEPTLSGSIDDVTSWSELPPAPEGLYYAGGTVASADHWNNPEININGIIDNTLTGKAFYQTLPKRNFWGIFFTFPTEQEAINFYDKYKHLNDILIEMNITEEVL